jgi:hypothetical protein
MATFTERMIGAARLDVGTYEEVEADAGATGQAMAVVILSSIAAGIGAGRGGVAGLLVVMVASLVGWFLWAFLAFLIGTKLLPEPQTRSNMGELLRTTGFSSSPGMLRVLGFIPFVGWLILLVVFFWMLASMVVAVRQALDYKSTGRAVVVCLIGWVIYIIVVAVFAGVLGVGLTG